MAAAFSLRQYSMERKRIAPEKTSSTPTLRMEEIDLLGGNGRWRQRKAETDFKQREIEEIERLRLQKIQEEARRKRKMELEAKRRRQLQEEENQRRAEREKEQREREEREEARRIQEEKERLQAEEEERERQARAPKTCETCAGSGRCVKCEGKGHLFAMFLVPSGANALWKKDQKMDFGRSVQGCDECGGYRQNLLGELRKGSGDCAACDGVGKITPKIDPGRSRKLNTTRTGHDLGAALDGSPKAMRRGSRQFEAQFGADAAAPAAS